MGGKDLAPRKKGLQGLAYYVIEGASKEELLTIAQQAQEVEAPIKWLTSSQLEILRSRRNCDPCSFRQDMMTIKGSIVEVLLILVRHVENLIW